MYRNRGQFAAAAMLLYALSAVPARAAVVTLDSQERVIEAHIAVVYGGGPPLGGVSYSDRVERASDFGPFSKRADFSAGTGGREPRTICAASAVQNSTILGSTVHADGSSYTVSGSDLFGNPGWGRAQTVFLIRFTVHEPCMVHLSGNAFVHAEPAEILLTGPDGIVWHSGRGSVPRPFDLPWQVLPPGQYTLHAEVIGTSAIAGFRVDMALDAPMVGVEPAAWSDVKVRFR